MVNIKNLATFKYHFFTTKSYVMIMVHDVFICKPGNASKLAKLYKEIMSGNEEFVNIMTDMTVSSIR